MPNHKDSNCGNIGLLFAHLRCPGTKENKHHVGSVDVLNSFLTSSGILFFRINVFMDNDHDQSNGKNQSVGSNVSYPEKKALICIGYRYIVACGQRVKVECGRQSATFFEKLMPRWHERGVIKWVFIVVALWVNRNSRVGQISGTQNFSFLKVKFCLFRAYTDVLEGF